MFVGAVAVLMSNAVVSIGAVVVWIGDVGVVLVGAGSAGSSSIGVTGQVLLPIAFSSVVYW